jgi:peptidoglycan/xylan/chitin deacetylase (PgdA/CDA1 family)
LSSGSLPERAAALTFDDGYRECIDHVLPELVRADLHATFFVPTGHLLGEVTFFERITTAIESCELDELDLVDLGLGRYTMDMPLRRGAVAAHLCSRIKYMPPSRTEELADLISQRTRSTTPPPATMTQDHLRTLAANGMEIGGHSHKHHILTTLSATEARRQIGACADELTAILGRPPRLFAYPNGKPGRDFTDEHKAMIRNVGFQAALSTRHGVASYGTDLFDIPRFTPWDETRIRFQLRMLWNLATGHRWRDRGWRG